jgi:septum formation protein
VTVHHRLVLASASPRRLELLRLAGLEPEVRPADVDETRRAGEPAAAYVERLAQRKAAVAACAGGEVLVAADTTVVLDGDPLGKPSDPAEARAQLRRLAGRSHEVLTAVAVRAHGRLTRSVLVRTEVRLTALSERAIADYVATGEPCDKAGGYGIQGRAAAFVARIDGSYSNVVGLPLAETLALLREAGCDLP